MKGSVARGRVSVFGDVQARLVQFRYAPSRDAGIAPASVSWSFLNPKVGVSAAVGEGAVAYASVGMNGREPTRADLFAGADNVDSATARSVLPLTRVHPETAYDLETGVTWHRSSVRAQANLFLMQFRDEIAPIGAINEIGYLLRKNVSRSVRRGAEGDLTFHLSPRVTAVNHCVRVM